MIAAFILLGITNLALLFYAIDLFNIKNELENEICEIYNIINND